jgi:predicted amidohydrolase
MSTLTITTIQSSLHWEDKQANLKMFEEKIMSIAEKTEVVVLPEMFSTGFSMNPQKLAEKMDGETVNWMKTVAAKKRIILTGSIIIEEGGHYFNRLIWMLPSGQFGVYDKRHLFAYADEHQHYTPGNKRLIASVKGWKINLIVCYDLRFPVWCRQSRGSVEERLSTLVAATPGELPAIVNKQEEPEYDLLICVANWPERRNHAWKTLLQARAIENQCYVVGVNRIGNDGNNIYHSGDTMITDAMGQVLYTREHAEDIFTLTLEKAPLAEVRKKIPFLDDADDFIIQS